VLESALDLLPVVALLDVTSSRFGSIHGILAIVLEPDWYPGVDSFVSALYLLVISVVD
jgi:hypothetical protein